MAKLTTRAKTTLLRDSAAFQAEYTTFKANYALTHPPPPLERGELTPRFWVIMVALCFLSAAVVSGAHTVPTIRDTIPDAIEEPVDAIVSIMGFFAIEVTLFVAAYMVGMYVHRRERANNKTGSLTFLYLMIGLATIVAVVANIYSSMTTLDATAALDGLRGVVGLVAGLSIPLIALMAGEVFARIAVEDSREQRRVNKFNADEQARWEEEALATFLQLQGYEMQHGKSSREVHEGSRAAREGGEDLREGSREVREDEEALRKRREVHEKIYERFPILRELHVEALNPGERKDALRKFLLDVPEGGDIKGVWLADLFGVSEATVSNVRRELKEAKDEG